MIEVETQTTEVEVINNVEVTSTSQVEVETVDLSDLDITVAKKEYVITGDDIYIPMLYDDAPQWMKDLVQLVVDVSISSGNQNLINDLSTMLKDFAVSYVPLNQYTQSILDLGDEDTRINALIETLNSNFNDGLSTANAQIISLQLTKASKDEVVAQVIQTIAAQLADGTSNIGSIIGRIDQAIATETSARALSLQTLTASLEDTNLDVAANAEVIQNALAYVGIDEAGASTGTGLSAYLEDSNGNIGGADSQLANSIRVTAEGVESKFAYNSIVNINGVYKKSGFGLTTNYTSGNGTQANPYVSEFWIDASRLKFTNSAKTGSKAPFTIQADGATPEIYFNGKVAFTNVTGYTPPDVSGSINANNNVFAQSQGFASYADMIAKYGTLGKTIITAGHINTGLVTGESILANSVSADRLVAGTNSSTVWTGGGLISQNFNGNPYGNIGSPTAGFRLSSNAAGTSNDPNIYGAYIRGGTMEGVSLNFGDIKIKSSTDSTKTGLSSYSTTSSVLVGSNYGTGHDARRVCSGSSSIIVHGSINYQFDNPDRSNAMNIIVQLQYSTDSSSYTTLDSRQEYLYNLAPNNFTLTTTKRGTIYLRGMLTGESVPSTGYIGFRVVVVTSSSNASYSEATYLVTLNNQ